MSAMSISRIPCVATAAQSGRAKALNQPLDTILHNEELLRRLVPLSNPLSSLERRAWAQHQWGSLAGDAAAPDPACSLSPLHAKVRALATEEAAETPPDYVYRTIGSNVRSPLKEEVNS